MATNFVALNGETPVQIETFEYEEDVWILQANFKLASGKSLRLDFYDFSDLHEVCVGGEPAAFLPLPILEFVHTEQPMEGDVYCWRLRTDRCAWTWCSEFPVEPEKANIALAEQRRIERDRKYSFWRRVKKLFGRKSLPLALQPSDLDQLLESLGLSAGNSFPRALNEANHLLDLGIAAQEKNQFDVAEKRYRKSIDLYSEHRDALTWAKGHHQMGNVNIAREHWGSARRWHLRSLEIARRNGLHQIEASSLYWLGHIELTMAAGDCGFDQFEASKAASVRADSSIDLANALFGMGSAQMARENYREALGHFGAALRAEEALPQNVVRQLQCHSSMVICAAMLPDFAGAEQFAQRAKALAQRKASAEAIKLVHGMFAFIEVARRNAGPRQA
jgi:tetratricopeptide (TPR) repeat protein